MSTIEKQNEIWLVIKTKCKELNNDFFIVNGRIASELADLLEFTIVTLTSAELSAPYLAGTIEGIKVYVDPLMKWNDLRVIFLDKNLIDLSSIIDEEVK